MRLPTWSLAVPIGALLTGASVPCAAAVFSAPIPDLVGALDPPGAGGRHANFDVGQQFSEIQNVWLEIEAHVVAREFDYCGTWSNPQPCAHVINLVGLFADMDEQESEAPGLIFTLGGLSFGEGDAPEATGTATAIFSNPLIGWDFLLDGESGLTVHWNAGAFRLDQLILNMTQPSGEIIDARIIIQGTPVPEPSTVLLLAVGLFAIGVRIRH